MHAGALDGVLQRAQAHIKAAACLNHTQTELAGSQLNGFGRRVRTIDGVQERQVGALACTREVQALANRQDSLQDITSHTISPGIRHRAQGRSDSDQAQERPSSACHRV